MTNVAQRAARAHKARLLGTPETPAAAVKAARAVGEPETPAVLRSQPIPHGQTTQVCVMCYIKGRNTPATWVTDHTGYACCDTHREILETAGAAAIQAARNKRR